MLSWFQVRFLLMHMIKKDEIFAQQLPILDKDIAKDENDDWWTE